MIGLVVVSVAGNALYDVGERRGLMWNTDGSFFRSHGFKYHEFGFSQWKLASGPWWTGRKSVLKLPIGYTSNNFEHDHLYYTFDFSPSFEYFFTPNISLRGMYSYAMDTYETEAPPDDKSGQDNINRIFGISPNFYFNNRNDILSFHFSNENLNSNEQSFTYDANNLAVSYFKQLALFDWDLEFYTRYKFTKKDYATAALLWPEGLSRKDYKHNIYMVISRNFWKHYFASLSYNWIKNDSNTVLYDFDKNVFGFSMGLKF